MNNFMPHTSHEQKMPTWHDSQENIPILNRRGEQAQLQDLVLPRSQSPSPLFIRHDPTLPQPSSIFNRTTVNTLAEDFSNTGLSFDARVIPRKDAKYIVIEYAQSHINPLAPSLIYDCLRPKEVIDLTQSARGATFTFEKLQRRFSNAMTPVIVEGRGWSEPEVSQAFFHAHMAVASPAALFSHLTIDPDAPKRALDEFINKAAPNKEAQQALLHSIQETILGLERYAKALSPEKDPVGLKGAEDGVQVYRLLKKAIENRTRRDCAEFYDRAEFTFEAFPGLLQSGARIVGAERSESASRTFAAYRTEHELGNALKAISGCALPIGECEEFVIRKRNEEHVKRVLSFKSPSSGAGVSMIVLGRAHDLSDAVRKHNEQHPNEAIMLLRVSAYRP